ncbi:sarcosine oxidase subunit gamma [Pseudogemmobacter humi]|uniref:Sarcosine oxidase, gamma subunit family n=1 Tax=Pseudogemmobacter humi TaxID=2483812 RepID=A0A3P5XE85_9RHOB|nr:sarcosine oxidase subunit gamma [Pseudogemmobacter humi]VDC28578.1 Sarcosine oxidase, gamma subunit family [Pseudogemmobacter humi]
MAELIAKPVFAGQGPLEKAGLTLEPLPSGPIWLVALYPGAAARAAKLLKPLGLSFPEPGRCSSADDLRLIWAGRDQAFLLGAAPPEGLTDTAALTDQSGGWAGLSLSGPGVEAALTRLVPLDLRLREFPPGRAARSLLNQIPALILREDETRFAIRVPRSMARSAWADCALALERLEARAER